MRFIRAAQRVWSVRALGGRRVLASGSLGRLAARACVRFDLVRGPLRGPRQKDAGRPPSGGGSDLGASPSGWGPVVAFQLTVTAPRTKSNLVPPLLHPHAAHTSRTPTPHAPAPLTHLHPQATSHTSAHPRGPRGPTRSRALTAAENGGDVPKLRGGSIWVGCDGRKLKGDDRPPRRRVGFVGRASTGWGPAGVFLS
jgi:hypothetical protein